ncbi:MAG: hypothetical protein ABI986_05290, partial [Chloroflexota bacterium]
SLLGLALLSIFVPILRLALLAELALYFLIMIFAGLSAAIRQQKVFLLLGLPLAIPVMHLTWGSGFLWSILVSSNSKHG